MKYTLLEMVQDILSDMDSDLVNSIDDTPEAQQVAQIIRTTYNDLISLYSWDHLKQLSQINAASIARPTHCRVADGVKEVLELRYNVKKLGDVRNTYKLMTYITPSEFLDMSNGRDESQTDITEVVDDSGVYLSIYNDRAPTYWTTFDDDYVVFDGYDKEVDDFIQNSKSAMLVEKEAEWTHTDNFTPDIPNDSFTLLLNEAKSRSFLVLAQEVNQKANQQAERARVKASINQFKIRGGITLTNFGRGRTK